VRNYSSAGQRCGCLFNLNTVLSKIISTSLIWTLVFSSLPAYAGMPRARAEVIRGDLSFLASSSAGLDPDGMAAPARFNMMEPGTFGSTHSGEGIALNTAALATALFQVTNAAVIPVLECVVNNGGGSYTARYGYQNQNTVNITIPVGDNNKFLQMSSQRGQTTLFLVGRQSFVFDVPFNGTTLVWLLKGPDGISRTVTASSGSPACNANHPPVANAGPAQTVFVGTTVHLNGTGSTDVDGDPLTYRWSFQSIPAGSTATLTGSTTATPSFTVDKPGSYTVQLTVNDGKVDSAPSTVAISTQNSPPVANPGTDQTVETGATVQLDGSHSSDVDGDPLTYLWSFVSTPAGSLAALANPATANPTFVTDKKGRYVIQLVVNDGKVNSAPSTVTISDINSAPIANAGANQTVTARSLVSLDGSQSTDVDGDALTYTWAILNAPAGSAATLSDASAVKPTFTVDVPGNYVIQLIVNDGTVDSLPVTVTISDQNTAPVANAGPAQTVPLGSLVTLDGTGSSDVDAQTLIFSWSMISSPAGSTAALSAPASASPSFTADKAGNYVIQLIVNDGIVNSQPATVIVSTINSIPVANPGANQTVSAGATVLLDASASSDADGDALTYTWAILSQPPDGTASLSGPHIVNPSFVANAAGLYVVQLIVNDGKVDSPPVTVSITANPVNQPPIVNAGPNQTITLPTNIANLNGTATDDGLPNGILNTTWSEVSGPAAVVFSSPNTAITQATFTIPGTYILRLTASDTVLSSSSDVAITVQPQPVNQAPVVSAGQSNFYRTGHNRSVSR